MRTAETRTDSWWFCENLVNHEGMVGLLRLDFPRVFILMRDYSYTMYASYEDWVSQLIEVNFLDPKDREGADLDSVLTEAWNFMALQEDADEALYERLEDEDDE